MLIYTLKRFGLAILVTFTVSMITFSLIYMAGDPAAAMAGETASDSDIAYLNELYGFDRPLPVQYAEWVSRAVQGDLGQSLYFKLPVSELLFDRLPVSMTLGICSIIFAILLAIPLGVVAAMRPNSWIDRVALTVSVCGQALPSFWFALLLIVAFAVTFPIFPITGADTPMHFVLPTIVLGYFATPAIMRLTRAGMLEVLSSDYIRTARAKGLSPRVVLFKHALRNAIIPVVSLAAVQFGFMLGECHDEQQARPSFGFALLLIVAFAVTFPIFPITGADTPMHFVLPTIVLGYFATPAIMRLTRAGMLEVLSSDYIRTARAKGLSPRVVLFKHALRNAIIPVVSLAAVQFGFMLGGSIVVESIFALHGAGYLAWESIGRHDLPVVQAIVLVFSLLYIILTFLADLLNAWLDPRIRVG